MAPPVTEFQAPHPPAGSRYLLLMSLGALGIVYGDIGTSPLYALRESFLAADGLPVVRDNVLGILSLMIWSLIVIVTIKYLVFVMRADNHGEGGILALTSLISPANKGRRGGVRWGLVLLGLFGTALLYGDGVITPAISVLSAVEGVSVASPALESFVVPAAIVILVGLFAVQHRGTGRIGAIFGPVMIVWFGVLGLLGLYRIAGEPGVVGAISPSYAISMFVREPRLAFLALGAVFLVVTGSEALYADMGHFGRRPIRLGWFTIVFPALLLNYLGQGALLIGDPDAISNPFYRMPPQWAVVPLVVLSTLATVIASQALISGAFSLTMQAIQLGYLPRVRIDHTSPRVFGQIYVPAVNWALMVACVAVVVGFGSASDLAAAYGVAVTSTMVITATLLYLVMRERWGWSRRRARSVTALFLAVDLAFFGANILKIPSGGWFPLVVAIAVLTVMTTWEHGRALLVARLRRGDLPIERFIGSITSHPQGRVAGTAVYLFPEPGATPPALLANLRHNEVIHETVVLVSVRTATAPRVPGAKREVVHHLGEGFHQVVLRFGFMQEPDVPKALGDIVHPEFGFDASDAVYFLGREAVVPSALPGMQMWRERLFAFMHRNAGSAAAFFGLPRDRVIEIGLQVEI